VIASEATRVLALLQAAYPNAKPLPEETVRLWVHDLMAENYDYADGLVAVEDVRRHLAFFPSLKELLDACYDARTERFDRETNERRALGSGALDELMVVAPDDVRERLMPYWEKFTGREAQELRIAVESDDPLAKLEAGRRVAAAMIDENADNAAEGQLKPLPPPQVVGRTACGIAWGELAEWDEQLGVYVCPNCRSPIKDGCSTRQVTA
jgi:hypothetical protein